MFVLLAGFAFSSAATLVGTSAIAEELRIVDSNGLTRAVKVLRGKARVVVLPKKPAEDSSLSCSASNVDGLVDDVIVNAGSDGTCTFDSLKSGSWRIVISPIGTSWSAKVEEQP